MNPAFLLIMSRKGEFAGMSYRALLSISSVALSLSASDAMAADGKPDKWGPEFQLETYLGIGRTDRDIGLPQMQIPLWQNNDSLLFTHIRYRFDNQSSQEYNLGLGYRREVNSDWILGGYGFFDRLSSAGGYLYSQGTFGLEALSVDNDARINIYVPESTTHRTPGGGSVVIRGNQIGIADSAERALPGADMEFGQKLPVTFADLRVYGGGYHYEADNFGTQTGPRGRIELTLNDKYIPAIPFGAEVTVGAEIQHDNVRGTESFGIFKIRVPLGGEVRHATNSLDARMNTFIRRDVDVITKTGNGGGLEPVKINGNTVSQVQTAQAGTALDTVINAAPNDSLIFVNGNGGALSMGSDISMKTGQTLLGSGGTISLTGAIRGRSVSYTYGGTTPTVNGASHVLNTADNTVINGINFTGLDRIYNSNGSDLTISHVNLASTKNTVATSGSDLAQGVFGIYNDGGTVTVSHSTISATADQVNYSSGSMGSGISAGAWGIYNTDGGTVAIDHSTVSANVDHVNYNAGSSTAGNDLAGAFGVHNAEGTVTISDSTVQATADNVVDTREPSGMVTPSVIGAFGVVNTKGAMTVTGSSSSITATATNVDNQGYDSGTSQGLLDYAGAFGAYNDGGGSGNTATLEIQQAHVTATATTVSSSTFILNDPAISSMGVWNKGNSGTATATIEQGAQVDADATWQITSTVSSGSAVNVLGLYNEGIFGQANLTADAATINVTQTGGDGSGGGMIAGVENGGFYLGSADTAVTLITGGTHITASGTGGLINVYGFYNNGNFDSTAGTLIEDGSIIDSQGGTSGASIAVYNAIGSMTIQGTAGQNVTLSAANGGGSGSTDGVWNDNSGSMAINYATIYAGPASGGSYSLGVNNTNNSTITVQNAAVTTVASLGGNAYGTNNDGAGSALTVSDSMFDVTASGTGVAYGLADQGIGGGTTINSPTALHLNYDISTGDAGAFSSTGTYTGQGNVTCQYNGVSGVCNTH